MKIEGLSHYKKYRIMAVKICPMYKGLATFTNLYTIESFAGCSLRDLSKYL